MFDLLLLGLLFGILWMVGAWLIYLLVKNPAIVDLAWAMCVVGITILYFFIAIPQSFIPIIALFSILLWGVRLSSLLIYRLSIHKVDKRYELLDEKWKKNLKKSYFFFFVFQGIGAFIISLPLAFIINYDAHFSLMSLIGLFFVILGFIGLTIADIQLQSFKSKQKNKQKVCNIGLWHYSRHPNYFFEWVFWVGQFLFAIYLPWGFLAIISPLGLLYLLLFVTGIPPAEEQSLSSKKQAYEEYQRTTNAFFPWLPKK